jgi:4-hydroxy-3-polyprenylbenzoate decarboxylase
MAYSSLQSFVQLLEKEGELIRISEFVSPKLEITEITDRISKKNGPAILFENTGTGFPLLINAFGSERRMCLALGISNLDQVQQDIEELFKKIASPKNSMLDKLKMLPALKEIASWMPKQVGRKGACQEVVMTEPDMTKLPVLTCWPQDGGPFVTLPVVHTQDPVNGTRNLGMYRMQVFGKDLTGMHWHLHKNSARHYNEYKRLGKRMPVSVTLGGDPAYTYSATAPLPDNFDEYILAGFLRRKKVQLVKCLTNDLMVPEDVDFVIEGYVDPTEELIFEGPFGDHTGFYSLADYYPKFHVTCITHRRNAIYPATIVGIPPQEDAYIGKATERIFLGPIRLTMHPDVEDIHMPVEGVFHNLVIFKTQPYFDGQALKIINGLWGAGQMMFTKVILAVDMKEPLTDYMALARYVSSRVNVDEDIIMSKGPSDVLDHSARKFALAGKLGIDACGEPQDLEHATLINWDKISERCPEIVKINESLVPLGISLLIISIKKSDDFSMLDLTDRLSGEEMIENVKCLVYVDEAVDVYDLKLVAWLVLNNIDPTVDVEVFFKRLHIDGTIKTKKHDHFTRDWPNVIAMDETIIKTVDEKWSRLGLGAFIESPSLKYRKLMRGDGACIEELD